MWSVFASTKMLIQAQLKPNTSLLNHSHISRGEEVQYNLPSSIFFNDQALNHRISL